jgi:hypothetical protein
MSLPDRQQQILDQIEQALQSADPALRSMYAMFGRLTSPEAMPATEAMPAGEGGTAPAAGAMGKAAVTGAAGKPAGTGAAGKSAGTGAAGKPAASWVPVGVVGPIASKAGVASTAAPRRRARRAVVISVIVLGMLGLMIFNVATTGSQCPGLSSDQVVASAAVRYAACNHSTDAWSKGAR